MKPVVLLQNSEIESAGTILEYLQARQIPHLTQFTFAQDELPEPTEFSAVISLGSPRSVTDYREYPYLQRLFEFTAKAIREDIPYLGICFGSQMLARVLGAEVKPNGEKEIGTMPVRLTEEGKQDPLFAGFTPEFQTFQWHGDTFKTPFGATLLAESDKCPRQAFRRGKQVGVQFHLEPTAQDVNHWSQAYHAELVDLSRTRDEIMAEFAPLEERIRKSNHQLLENFFQLTRS